MALDKKASPVETIESLMKEAESLKLKLEDERQKLNDVTCKNIEHLLCGKYIFILFSGSCSRTTWNYKLYEY